MDSCPLARLQSFGAPTHRLPASSRLAIDARNSCAIEHLPDRPGPSEEDFGPVSLKWGSVMHNAQTARVECGSSRLS
jgi:hypothetical protein